MRFAALALLVGMVGPPAAAQEFAGSAACRACHSGLFRSFTRNPHYASIAAGDFPGPNTGCESCHGPASNHLTSGGRRGTIPNAFSPMPPGAVTEVCSRCHAQSIPQANLRRSEHTLNGVVCTNCHSIHGAASARGLLRTAQERDLCYGCHTNVRAQFAMPFKHRVNEGSVRCGDCHDPHGSFAATWNMAARPRLAGQVLGNEQACMACHTDKRGPFVFEHAAGRVEGCEACHNAHGSPNPRLLKRPVIATQCLECHTGRGGFGLQQNGVAATPAFHNLNNATFQNCTACHVRIHGSNADAHFLR
jgi:DmsE family decaheme c-type cytochrome